MLSVGWWAGASAQVFEPGEGPRRVWTDTFWNGWFVQADLDMTLQNPYGYNFADAFPNGLSYGLDVAVGKWFSHQVGFRGKLNWENKLPLLKNDHANWLAPFDQPGVNREKGGYVAICGDVLLNLHNLLGNYRPDRAWNLSLYPRVGVNYNFGVSKGALMAGVGLMNTYRLSPRWSIVLDAAYNMTGSGFVGKTKEKGGTGTGKNSNGYFTLGLGAQMDLGPRGRMEKGEERNGKWDVMTNGIWDNWFVQAGVDMSLMKPYGCDFSKVIPNGTTLGLNGAMGKWFTPDFALRARVQWDNGLIPNNGVEWLAPADDPKQNYKKGGLAVVSLDGMLNLTNVTAGYDPERKWHTSAYLRMGIITQFAVSSASPVGGAGLEETYRLNDRLSLLAAAGYQVTTSEGMGVSTTGMNVAAGSNGFFDINVGIRYDLGRNRFCRGSESKAHDARLAAQASRNWPRFAANTLASVGAAYAGKTALKAVVKEERPDHSDNKSFPSGHAAMAFAAARSLDKEFRQQSVWIPIAGYAAATAIGMERVANDRHHWYDVVAGAALGVGAAELTWWVSDKLLGGDSSVAVGTSGNAVDVVYRF